MNVKAAGSNPRMMKSVFTSLFFMLFLSIQLAFSQENAIELAINFENLSFEEAKKIAQQSGKAIFMDVYAVWCIPCKQFEKKVFTDKEVGVKFNAWFVNLKIDAEKEEGKKIAKLYQVGGYPTGIFINPEGQLLSKFEGVLPKDEFITYGENALRMMDDPNGYEKAVSLYAQNKNDLETIRNLMQKSILSGNQIPPEAMNIYFSKATPKTVAMDSALLKTWINASPTVESGKETYRYFLSNLHFAKEILQLDDNFFKTFFYNSLQTSTQTAAHKKAKDELIVVLQLNSKLPQQIRQAENIDYELDYYLECKEFREMCRKMTDYCHTHFDKIKVEKIAENEKPELAARINNFAWNYLVYSDNTIELNYAETLIKKAVELDSSFAAWYDTFAGIVYKKGDTIGAIEIENKAVTLSKNSPLEQGIYLKKIARMKQGEKIWLPEQY